MAKSTRKADVQSQSRDSKGVNQKRDASRAKGTGAVTMTKGQGTGQFRKIRSGVE